ncbi:hypothetical protein Desaci_1272 [Desulfosporosinus acidiphilus SJ4]|uniref:Uncharacterized protein n=1 Tax=Desulfosporosinus acidiphilus (strain DSM 22704 / JCM 16185 / SJ4) TaxID=646529 RepID=I4D3C5_DESAJ|nr:hypothetical protein [Desulfosporosinus acidiphilus]AFM40299.1 hypothetical protein Desaci_1272 [Desulfosporosinus acidiphilus SJ4]
MPGKLKIEIIENDIVLEIYESEPGKLSFVMYPDDPKNETYLELVTDTSKFSGLLKRLLDNKTPRDLTQLISILNN